MPRLTLIWYYFFFQTQFPIVKGLGAGRKYLHEIELSCIVISVTLMHVKTFLQNYYVWPMWHIGGNEIQHIIIESKVWYHILNRCKISLNNRITKIYFTTLFLAIIHKRIVCYIIITKKNFQDKVFISVHSWDTNDQRVLVNRFNFLRKSFHVDKHFFLNLLTNMQWSFAHSEEKTKST